jgi:hypothetical protein
VRITADGVLGDAQRGTEHAGPGSNFFPILFHDEWKEAFYAELRAECDEGRKIRLDEA